MKIKNVLFCLVPLFSFFVSKAQEGYPTPPETPNQLFYIQHSENHNTYVYDANLIERGISNDNPVEAYRIIYTKGGEKAPLTRAQQKFAYGISHKRIEKNEFHLFLPMSKEIIFQLKLNEQEKPVVYVEVNNRKLLLKQLFIQIREGSGLNVKIDHVRFIGSDVGTGKPVTEKMILKK